MKIKVDIEFIKIKEDARYEYLIPIYPFCSCKFNELEQKCKELKERLPEDVVEVRVPTMEEVESLPEEIYVCDNWWWTSTRCSNNRGEAYHIYPDGYIDSYSVNYTCGFRPIITRRKY